MNLNNEELKKILPTKYENIKDWKIAYSLDLGFFEVDSEVEKNTLEALKKFEALGASITEVKLNWKQDEVNSVCFSHYANSFYGLISKLSDSEKEQLTNYAQMFAEVPEMHFNAIQNNKKIYQNFLYLHKPFLKRKINQFFYYQLISHYHLIIPSFLNDQ